MSAERTAATELAPVEPRDEGGPHIHAPAVFGARVGGPFFLPIPTTGERPLRFSAEGLPDGLTIDEHTGVITGRTDRAGETTIRVTATNAHGTDEKAIQLVVGGRLALAPPLGWNSWNCWGASVDAAKVRAAAEAMVSTGLAAHGYNYVNIDDGWQGERGPGAPGLGALQPNEKFPDMKGLCDHVHSLGLRIGIYSTPWVKSYAGYNGGSTGKCIKGGLSEDIQRGRYIGETPYHTEDARQWAEWGIDYLKYDWGPWEVEDVRAMAEALNACGRDIVYSLSNCAPFPQAGEWARLANCWRTTGDIFDEWENLSSIGFTQDRWTPYGGPGHWNDPDMLVVGRLGWGEVRENRLTRDEQITHITLWALLAAPMLIGCDMTSLDQDFTLRLLCNDEMLQVNQDPLGRQGWCLREVSRADPSGRPMHHAHVYVRPLHDGALAVGFFNRGPEAATVEVTWAELEIEGARNVLDIWARKDVGRAEDRLAVDVPPHGAQFVRISG